MPLHVKYLDTVSARCSQMTCPWPWLECETQAKGETDTVIGHSAQNCEGTLLSFCSESPVGLNWVLRDRGGPMGAACAKRAPVIVRAPVQLSPERSAAATASWGRLVKKACRVRTLQRYWAYIGHRLQEFPKALRTRLVRLYPQVR